MQSVFTFDSEYASTVRKSMHSHAIQYRDINTLSETVEQEYVSLITTSYETISVFLQKIIDNTLPLNKLVNKLNSCTIVKVNKDCKLFSFTILLEHDIRLSFILRYAEASFDNLINELNINKYPTSNRDFIFFIFQTDNRCLKEALWKSGFLTKTRRTRSNVCFISWNKAIDMCVEIRDIMGPLHNNDSKLNQNDVFIPRGFLSFRITHQAINEVYLFTGKMIKFREKYFNLRDYKKSVSYTVFLYGSGWDETRIKHFIETFSINAEIIRIKKHVLKIIQFKNDISIYSLCDDLLFCFPTYHTMAGQLYCLQENYTGECHELLIGKLHNLHAVKEKDGANYLRGISSSDYDAEIKFDDGDPPVPIEFTIKDWKKMKLKYRIKNGKAYQLLGRFITDSNGKKQFRVTTVLREEKQQSSYRLVNIKS